MGLFDKIFNEVPEEDKLSKQEAFAGIALAGRCRRQHITG